MIENHIQWYPAKNNSKQMSLAIETHLYLESSFKVPLQYVCVSFTKILIPKAKKVTINHKDMSFDCLVGSVDSNSLSTSFQIDFSDITNFRYSRKNFLFNISLTEGLYKQIFPNQTTHDPLFRYTIWFCLDFANLQEYESSNEALLKIIPNEVNSSEISDSCYQRFCQEFCILKPDSKLTRNIEQVVVMRVPEPPKKKRRKEEFLCDEKFSPKKQSLRNDIKYVYDPSPNHSVEISQSDFRCLRPRQYINDNIINIYITYLFYEKLSEVQRNRTHFFNCFFNMKLIGTESEQKTDTPKSRHERVAKWTKNVDIFEKDFLIIPVIENQHWFLVIVCFPWMAGLVDYKKLMSNGENQQSQIPVNDSEWARVTRLSKLDALTKGDGVPSVSKPMPCILIFDSIHSMENRSGKVNIIREYLKSEWDTKRASRDGPLIFDRTTARGYCPKIPLQNNTSDCGLYLLHYIELFYQNPIQEYTVDFFREKLVGWFERDVISKKRKMIEETIRKVLRPVDSA